MRVIASMLLTAAAFGAAEPLAATDGVLAALIAVAGGVALASLAAGAPSATAVTLGALGALGHALLWQVWPALGGATLLALATAPRALRARTAPEGVAIVAIGALAGGLGAWLALSFADGPVSLGIVAAAMAGLLAGTPWLLGVDDPTAHALRVEARRTSGAARWLILRALVLRRRSATLLEELPAREAQRLEQAWQTLLTLVDARHSAPRSASERIDARIREHADALGRVWRACGTRRALADGLDLEALDGLQRDGDEAEAEAEALAEVGWEAAPAARARAER